MSRQQPRVRITVPHEQQSHKKGFLRQPAEDDTPCFLTPRKTNTSVYSSIEEPKTSRKKKYPETWRLYVLPGLQDSTPQNEESRCKQSMIATTKCSQISSRMPMAGRLSKYYPTMMQQNGSMKSSQTVSDGNQLSERFEYKAQVINANSLNNICETGKQHGTFTKRIALQNSYLKDEVEYLREKFTNCLIRKCKPGSSHLYD